LYGRAKNCVLIGYFCKRGDYIRFYIGGGVRWLADSRNRLIFLGMISHGFGSSQKLCIPLANFFWKFSLNLPDFKKIPRAISEFF
jgi:hypothetical protein